MSSGDCDGCVFLRRSCLKAMARKPRPNVSCSHRNGFHSRRHFECCCPCPNKKKTTTKNRHIVVARGTRDRWRASHPRGQRNKERDSNEENERRNRSIVRSTRTEEVAFKGRRPGAGCKGFVSFFYFFFFCWWFEFDRRELDKWSMRMGLVTLIDLVSLALASVGAPSVPEPRTENDRTSGTAKDEKKTKKKQKRTTTKSKSNQLDRRKMFRDGFGSLFSRRQRFATRQGGQLPRHRNPVKTR